MSAFAAAALEAASFALRTLLGAFFCSAATWAASRACAVAVAERPVACTIYGRLAWISNPVNGSRHDDYCQEESGVLLTMNPKNWIGDKVYIGNNMLTPYRKPAGGDLLDW